MIYDLRDPPTPEYRSFQRIAEGTSSSDLEGALTLYYQNRSLTSEVLEFLGIRTEPVHITAFRDVLHKRSGFSSQLSR